MMPSDLFHHLTDTAASGGPHSSRGPPRWPSSFLGDGACGSQHATSHGDGYAAPRGSVLPCTLSLEAAEPTQPPPARTKEYPSTSPNNVAQTSQQQRPNPG